MFYSLCTLYPFACISSSSIIFIFLHARSDIANAILKLCHRIKNRTNAEYGLEWLFGLPLYNLLTENSAPFEDVTLKKNSQLLERWTAVEEKLHLNELRRRTFDCGVK